MHDLVPPLLALVILPGLVLLALVVWLGLSLHRVALRFSLLRTTAALEPALPALPRPVLRRGPRTRLPRQAEA
jgi:hypothetical protein